jgi:hypothetical protein
MLVGAFWLVGPLAQLGELPAFEFQASQHAHASDLELIDVDSDASEPICHRGTQTPAGAHGCSLGLSEERPTALVVANFRVMLANDEGTVNSAV